MDVAKSSVIMCADIPVIVVGRYDRFFDNDVLLRLHQEDMCQARSVYPERKYENEGGPRVADISEIIWDYSDNAYEDITKFADALILNFLIIGTDAHAKNYSLLHLSSQRIRLTPLYDVVSALPYPNIYNPKRVKFAMKIGSEYLLRKIEQRHWEACAKQLKLKPDYLMGRLKVLAEDVMQKTDSVVQRLNNEGLEHEIIKTLNGMIKERCKSVLTQFSGN
jgi:serine/threonine-protein kinase HipA